jgi:hypothetical protein
MGHAAHRDFGDGIVVGPPGWEQRLDANQNAYMAEFVGRGRFPSAYPLTMPAAQFVDQLNQNAGGVLTQAERDALVNDLSDGSKTRARRCYATSPRATRFSGTSSAAPSC